MPPTTDQQWLNDEEQAAWRAWQRMHLQLTGRLNRQLAEESGISLQDYGVLVTLTDRADGRMRAFELGRELGWEKSRLSHHVSRMVERGFVTRERCPTDQRGLFIAVTPKGRAAIEAAAPGHVAEVRRSFIDLLTPEQLRAVAEVAGVVLDALAEECARAVPEAPDA
ncbi:MAG TPA: MarR family winged helix-turn-helix transcriptional regulator [Acidimicrobiales bacterium]|nr:MarR family winged helix-turn-helix transcriptional regulator [Acidimicrobiales bacterium]